MLANQAQLGAGQCRRGWREGGAARRRRGRSVQAADCPNISHLNVRADHIAA